MSESYCRVIVLVVTHDGLGVGASGFSNPDGPKVRSVQAHDSDLKEVTSFIIVSKSAGFSGLRQRELPLFDRFCWLARDERFSAHCTETLKPFQTRNKSGSGEADFLLPHSRKLCKPLLRQSKWTFSIWATD